MQEAKRIKLFISYSHLDEEYVKAFIRHIAPLKVNGLIEAWYDRKIIAGSDYQNKINNKLEDADVVCLFISANFLSSSACIEEKNNAFNLMKKVGITILPIILSPCGWLDDKDLSPLLALPTDGKPITDFSSPDNAWKIIYDGLKDVLVHEIKIKTLEITDKFFDFLQDTELLSRAHSQKEKVTVEDIFVYPDLTRFDILKDYEKKINSSELIRYLHKYNKIIIAGENQSGKTTLCKKLFLELRKINFVPIYIFDRNYQYGGKLENRIVDACREQYKNVPIEEIDKKRIIPIIDDFHLINNKEKYISDLSSYMHQIIIVDDIFSLNIKDESLINSFIHYKIEELNPRLRDQLIKKWTHLRDTKRGSDNYENEIYKIIDEQTELVNTTLGKIFGKGIMPAYPFFILSIISTYDAFGKPLDEDITSQGYCYQAFIYMYLRKHGVKNDEIDTYINFLDEFAFLFFSKEKSEISKDEFNLFMASYLNKFNLPVDPKTLLITLLQSNLISLDNLNNYYFKHQYLYYFFVAKYLAEHIKENGPLIDKITNNLHKDENAYIAIFISHHTKNEEILDGIILNALYLFDKYEPATLGKEELNFFEEQEDDIIQAALPAINETPEIEREKRLSAQSDFEEENSNKRDDYLEEYDEFAKQLRRSIKTVEVIGSIIKNRSGSLSKDSLKSMFETAVNVHLRILASFFDVIKSRDEQQETVNLIADRLRIIIENKSDERRNKGQKQRETSKEQLEKISKTIFWNLNFLTVYGLIYKIITSLGSSKLTQIVEAVCDKINTPASFLIKHGIFMWYNKNLQVDNIANKISENNFAKLTKKIINFLIVDHCSMHKIDYRDRQKIEKKLMIPSKKILECQSNVKEEKKR